MKINYFHIFFIERSFKVNVRLLPSVSTVALLVHTLVVVVAAGAGLEGEVTVAAVSQLTVAPSLVVQIRVRLGGAPG